MIGGRLIDTNIEAPQYPINREECAQFRADVSELHKQVNEAHDACLADRNAQSGGGSGGDPQGRCSKPACQKLHTARDELSTAMSKGYGQCMEAINERQRSERWGNSTYGTDLDEFKAALKSGPISAVRSLVKKEIDKIIDKTFGYAAPSVKSGLDVAQKTNTIVTNFSKLQAACKTKSSAALNACNKEMLATLQDLPSMVPGSVSGDPGISLIQRAAMTRLNLIMRDTLDQVDRLGEQMDEVTADDSRPSQRSTRRRVTPRIEND